VKDTRLENPAFLHTLAHGPILVEALLRCTHCKGGEVSIQQGRELEIVEMTAAANPSQAG
jgi:Zn finger protein HypA/HybF involved in hydrogenase expression